MGQCIDFEREIASCKAVINFDCAEEILEKRLLKRGETSGRTDDNLESIKKRFKTFVDQTKPVIEYFQEKNKVLTIDSSGSFEETFSKVEKALNLN
jgi:adenylate kinase family enzyme